MKKRKMRRKMKRRRNRRMNKEKKNITGGGFVSFNPLGKKQTEEMSGVRRNSTELHNSFNRSDSRDYTADPDTFSGKGSIGDASIFLNLNDAMQIDEAGNSSSAENLVLSNGEKQNVTEDLKSEFETSGSADELRRRQASSREKSTQSENEIYHIPSTTAAPVKKRWWFFK